MKKIILGGICGLLALTMVGCGTSGQDAAIKNLSKQLDRVTNTVNSMTTTQFAELSPNSYLLNQNANRMHDENYRHLRPINQQYNFNNQGYVASQITKMEASSYEQEALKQNILNQTAMLKNSIGQKLKLSKNQIKAINNLTNSICKYTTNLNSTKTDINNSIKNIRKVKNVSTYNEEQMGAYYQSLNNNFDARLCYFRNLINTMDQVQNILNCDNCNENQNNENTQMYNNQNQQSQKSSIKNTDTYYNPNVNNGVNQVVQNNGYNSGYYNNGYNNYYNNGYNNGYNYNNFRNNAFNPNRNTDTYAPLTRNIDTYRNFPNNSYPNINNQTIPANNTTDINLAEDINQTEKEEGNIIRGKVVKSKNNMEEKEAAKTQEVKRFHPANSFPKPAENNFSKVEKRMNTFEVDHMQTNKKIEKLIRG